MSKENKAQYAELLSSIYATYTTAITSTRAITLRQLNEIADTLAVTTPQEAYNFKFVTSLGYYNDVETILKNKLNLAHEDALRYVKHYDYTMPKSRHHTPKQNIAVIIAEGDIVSGNSTETNIGSQDLAQTIRKLRKDKNVKAVVLRINSPGGSALASDVLWKELMLLKETKPVIASLSSVAASGGYYLAVACDKICAHPNTITGSIGVFAMFFEVHNLLKNKFGITTDTVKTNKYADCFENFGRTLDEHEKKMIHKNIEKTYSSFLNRISQGRNLSVPAIQKVASGRVWSGIAAKEKKLVDAIGGLDEAIEMAASIANVAIGDVYVTYWPKPKRAWDRLAGKLKHISVSLLQSPQELVSSEILNFKKLLQMQDPQMRLTYDILID
jgi:protease-4